MALSQKDRLIRIATPLGENTFIVLSFTGAEEISELFSFELELASERNDITFDDLAGKNVTVSIRSSDGDERFFNGIIIAFSHAQVSEKEGYNKYKAIMQPSVWLLTKCHDCRIFQDKSVPDIIKEVLGDACLGTKKVKTRIEHRLELSNSYSPRKYCVQYNESDFAFICRICENEGIFYFFEHQNGKHTLVFCDAANKHKPYMAGKKETVRFQNTLGAVTGDEVLLSLQQIERLTTAQYTARDYNFTTPETDMTVSNPTAHNKPRGQGETYEYPGGYEKTSDRGKRLSKIRIEAEDALVNTLSGKSNCRHFIPGYTFTLDQCPLKKLNGKKYVFTKVQHMAKQDFISGNGSGDNYHNFLRCIPYEIPYRPKRKTARPAIVSSQTAIVTGPEAEEIHTDKHGRVKVKFFWDRRTDQNGDGNMSCWIRVSQNWAGGKWGAMHIPRVGQEVIVNFLDGDPDRPMITGRVYHGNNLPPYDLPAEKTKSTIMSNSTKNGNGNFNEIRFEDLKDAEEIFTHAAKDQNEVVENDMSTQVKNDQSINVQNNRALTVAAGSETHTIEQGGRQVSVTADEKHINKANYLQKVGADFTLKVNGNLTLDASGILTVRGAKVIIN